MNNAQARPIKCPKRDYFSKDRDLVQDGNANIYRMIKFIMEEEE